MLIDRTRMPEPSMPPAGFQRWSNLAFVHWRVPLEPLRALVPQSLSIDTWDGDAWLGMVAFTMSGVRPAWAPALPYLSAFPETNLRTYVHLNGAEPGVWFFSLDASRWLAVQAARWGWGLNYRLSRMRVTGSYAPERANRPVQITYQSSRRRGPPCQVSIQLAVPSGQTVRAAPLDSLEYFLCERYLLYTLSSRKQLWKARVHHAPHPLLDAQLMVCGQGLTESIGCCVEWPEHIVFSPGVDVRVYPMQRVSV